MRIVVVSDSHGATGRLSTILMVAEQAGWSRFISFWKM